MPSFAQIGPLVIKKIINFVNNFLLSHHYLPLKKCMVLYLNKLESPSPKDTLCQAPEVQSGGEENVTSL